MAWVRINRHKCWPTPWPSLLWDGHWRGGSTQVTFGHSLATTIRCEDSISLVSFWLQKGNQTGEVAFQFLRSKISRPCSPGKDHSIPTPEAQGPGVVLLAAGFSPLTASPLPGLGQLPLKQLLSSPERVNEKQKAEISGTVETLPRAAGQSAGL